MRKAITTVVAGLVLAWSAQPSMAVGFGRLVNATTLGQSLDVTVAINADATDQITSECVSAEVVVGDSLLPHPAVRVRLDPSAGNGSRLLHVTTTVRVHEPIVTVKLSVACPSLVNRQFVVFVDPPLTAYDAAAPLATEPALPGAAVARAPAASAIALSDPAMGRSEDLAAQTGAATPPAEPSAARTTKRATRSASAKAPSSRAANRAQQASARKARRVGAPDARGRTAPRLQLERGIGAAPMAVAAAAASAVPENLLSMPAAGAASAVAPTDAERALEAQRVAIESLQQRLDKLQLESEASGKSIAQLQARLQEAEASRSSGWLSYALVAVGAALLLWIGLRVGRRGSASGSASGPGASWWSADAAPAPTDAGVPRNPAFAASAMARLPETAELLDDTPTTDPVPLVIAPPPPGASVAPARFGDTPQSFDSASAATSASRLSADELIDLEQQAEFFVALGQDDSAVDLLNAFLRGNGGVSALAYLKLIEIHRRRGEREAHDRIRERHQRRFGALTAAWDDEPAVAQCLEDHAEVMARIEAAWADPAEAMRVIESLLVGGEQQAASFDLTTLGDLQFLYQLARSERESEVPEASSVDLLLPLSAGDEVHSVVDSTSPRPHAIDMPVDSSFSTPSDIDLELDFMPARTDAKPLD